MVLKKKVIKILKHNTYFDKYENGALISTSDPLYAQHFLVLSDWYKEEELNKVLSELDDEKVEYEVMVLNYSVDKL